MLSLLTLIFSAILLTSKATILSVTHSVSNQNIVITLNINTDTETVDVTLSGPATRWFGVGFGSTTMQNTYAIITDNGQGTNTITERKLGQASQGNILSSTINIQTDQIINNTRIITIQRNRIGSNNDYYTFPNAESDINIIWAFSNSLSNTFTYHGSSLSTHDTSVVTLIEDASQTTPAPTSMYTTMPFNICNDERCKYIILITFEISYSFTDGSNVDSSGFKTVVISSMENILNQWIPNANNIKISLTSIYPQINIGATMGVEDDIIYNNILDALATDIINIIDSDLPNDVNAVYTSAGFSIEHDIITDFEILNGTVITEEDDKSKQKGLFAFINFSNYRLYDWIVLGGFIILIFLCCFCCTCICYWCYERRRISKIPDSEMNAKTGSDRISIFRRGNPMKKTEIKQQDGLFQLKNNQPLPDERYANEPETKQLYTSNYAASPMRHEWNNAFNAAANTQLPTVGSQPDDENVIGGQRGIAPSVAMSTVSFGKGKPAENFKLIPEDNEQDEYFDYEQEFEQGNVGGNSGNGGGGGPPVVSGSMVNRMNVANNGGDGGPPVVSGSMVNRMNVANDVRNEAYV